MLLLVLVFVLAAFGLLLVALVTGSATWAWASVAVSVAAAGALVFDWVQRRAAVNDGSRAATPVGAGARVGGALEPPTTAIPPVGAQLGGRAPEPATQLLRPMAQPAPQWGAPSGDGAQHPDHQHATAPSGSAEQPPSAGPGVNQQGTDQSQPVTESEPGHAPAAAQGGVTPSGDAHPGAAAAAGAVAAAAAGAVAGQQVSPQQAVPGAGAPPAKPRDKSQAWKSALSGADPVMAKGATEAAPAADQAEATADAKADQAAEPAAHPNVSAPAQAGTGQAADKPADAKGAVTDSDQTTAIRPQGIADAPTEAIRVDKVNQPAPSAPAANPLFSKPAQPQARPEAPKSGIPGRAAAAAAGAVAAGAAAVGKLQSIGKPQSIGTPPTGKPEQPASGSKPGEAGSKPGAAADAAATSDAASGAKDSAKSGLTSPTEVIKPDAAKPDTAEPDTAKPDTAKPDTAKPDTAKPDAAKDAPAGADTTAKPDTTKSDAGAAAQKPSAPDGSEAATQAISAIRPPAEPGEERPDPAAAAIVAKLGDEVLVVDEQPRYHLAGCRTLSGQETIPLPAREAVEYEFSPCAECTPVRILAARNRASSKS